MQNGIPIIEYCDLHRQRIEKKFATDSTESWLEDEFASGISCWITHRKCALVHKPNPWKGKDETRQTMVLDVKTATELKEILDEFLMTTNL
jgi:hypothetical protein